ncbi:hypothetical protein BDD12DRAFT_880445 [Trichophaea hybrida]|nr:hypothetical protein BDD12DRAFT_880445 [Trichophaea hybrida]
MSSPAITTANTPTSSTPTPPVSKGRKGAAAGGGKAWTADEEVYLLQMRLERVAYKKIASKLDKTELACRLHYHQLSHGGNRRKRNNSISSNSSNTSVPSPATSPSAESASAKSFIASSFSPVNAAGAIQKPGVTSTLSKIKGKPLLPKPVDGSTGSGAGIASTPRRQTNAKGGKPLRVHCNPDSIDKDRLWRLVKGNESKFWDSIAEQYGESIEGEYLRAIWQKGLGSETPPTPAISPASQATSPVGEMSIEDGNSHTIATVSEVSTPASATLSPTSMAFHGSDVAAIREPMDDLMEDEDEETTCKQSPTMESIIESTPHIAS